MGRLSRLMVEGYSVLIFVSVKDRGFDRFHTIDRFLLWVEVDAISAGELIYEVVFSIDRFD
jgi:hypothetical protein